MTIMKEDYRRFGRFEVLRRTDGAFVIFDPERAPDAPIPTFKSIGEANDAASKMALKRPGVFEAESPLLSLGVSQKKPPALDPSRVLVRLRLDVLEPKRAAPKRYAMYGDTPEHIERLRFSRWMPKDTARDHVAAVNRGDWTPALVAWLDGEREPQGMYPEKLPVEEEVQLSNAVRCAECASETVLFDALTGDARPFLEHSPPCSFDDAIQAGKGPEWVREHGGKYPITFYRFTP